MYIYNIYIYKGFLHFFQILIFGVIRRVKGQKVAQNDKNNMSVALHRRHTSYDCDFWYTSVK